MYKFVIEKNSEMIEEKYNIYMDKAASGHFPDDERQEIVEAIIAETKA